MARRRSPSPPPDPAPKVFANQAEIDRAIAKLERRLTDVRSLRDDSVRHDDKRVDNIEAAISKSVLEIFGAASPEYRRHQHYRFVDFWPINALESVYQGNFESALPETITELEGLIDALRETALDFEPQQDAPTIAAAASGEGVFLVHGRNEEWLREAEHLLASIGLRATVLRKQPNRGRTIIEKFEDHASAVGFAIVLLTGDDEGRLRSTPGEETELSFRTRARQNVILELGFFLGRLGRSRVCALYEEGVEVPSDYSGVVFVPLNGSWRAALVRELHAAGLDFDLGRAIQHL